MKTWYILICLAAPALAGCQGQEARAAEPRQTASPTGRKPAEPTPEVIEKAEALLKANPDAKVGAEMPFSLDGKRYVARVEEHDNPNNEPGRPPGKHKGITVYEAR